MEEENEPPPSEVAKPFPNPKPPCHNPSSVPSEPQTVLPPTEALLPQSAFCYDVDDESINGDDNSVEIIVKSPQRPLVQDAGEPETTSPKAKEKPSEAPFSPEIEVVKSNTTNPLMDYPHMRDQCAKFYFTTDPKLFCSKCFCYLCDKLASDCSDWERHCKADSKERRWKKARHILLHPNEPDPYDEDSEEYVEVDGEEEEFVSMEFDGFGGSTTPLRRRATASSSSGAGSQSRRSPEGHATPGATPATPPSMSSSDASLNDTIKGVMSRNFSRLREIEVASGPLPPLETEGDVEQINDMPVFVKGVKVRLDEE